MRRFATLAAVALALLLAAPLAAATLAGVTMPDSAKAGDHQLALNGMALRSKAVFKVYVGGLYLPDEEHDWKKVLGEDGPRPPGMQGCATSTAAICEADECLEPTLRAGAGRREKNFETLRGSAGRQDQRPLRLHLPPRRRTRCDQRTAKGNAGATPFATPSSLLIAPTQTAGAAFREGLMGNAKYSARRGWLLATFLQSAESDLPQGAAYCATVAWSSRLLLAALPPPLRPRRGRPLPSIGSGPSS